VSAAERAAAALGGSVADVRPLGGGDISDAAAIRLQDGREAFVKSGRGAFRAEAAGLAWLAEPAALRVPQVLHVADDLLVLELVAAGRLSAEGEEELGRGLAALHAAGADAFGVPAPGTPRGVVTLGAVELPGHPQPTAAAALDAQLASLTAQAVDAGGLDRAGADALDRLRAVLDDRCGPADPPARIHGDLWAGNVLADATGRPWLIDPGAHGGHREADLALLRLFGGVSERVPAAYAEAAPLADGHEERFALWQLVPLLVHATLFGGSYGPRARQVAEALA
jgi:fructosamine-3-kinase